MSRHRFSRRRAAALVSAVFLSTSALAAGPSAWCGERCDEVVVDWNAVAFAAIRAHDGYADPLHASRALAMLHLAMHDAVNAAQPRYATWTSVAGDASADPTVAAVVAAHDVLAALYPGQQALAKATLDKSLLDAGAGPGVASGIALGRRAAAAVLERRAQDGSAVSVAYTPGTRPGEYRYTPGFNFVAHPQWKRMQPFALATPAQFRVGPPPALTSAAYAADFNEVKRVGGKQAPQRTVDETNYAAFWYEFSDIGWNRVARVAAREKRQDLWQRARTFAQVNVALADAYVAGWDSKFHYDLWRPVTAIRLADADGNAATSPDASFEPLLPTPPVQDYPSTHSALGAAAAVVLADAFGDRTRFTMTSTSSVPANPVRTFPSFSEAARENADSRVKAGIHFRFATTAGLKLGEDIGRHVVTSTLRPLH